MSQENEVIIDLNDFTGNNADSVIISPAAKIFSREDVDLSDLRNVSVTNTEETITENPDETPNLESLRSNDITEQLLKIDTEESTEVKGKSKDSFVSYLKNKIESQEFVTFDDYDEKVPLDEYLSSLPLKELQTLADENLKYKEQSIQEKIAADFIESLPEELKIAAEYWQQGGEDFKGLFQALGHVREIQELDPTVDSDQKEIVRQYFRNVGDLTEDEIEAQVEEWDDMSLLKKKAEMLKPKLDNMKKQMVEQRKKEAELQNVRKQEAQRKYVDSVYEALKSDNLNGVPVDVKKREALYRSLVNAEYTSISGGNTNKLGHLLEKYQVTEPNYTKIAKVLWLLEDEEGYEKALLQKGASIKAEEIAKKLKTVQSDKSSSNSSYGESKESVRKVIPKAAKEIFKR
jgi:hypothetical protein